MSVREIYECAYCNRAHSVVRIPLAGKPWERRPYAVDCPSTSPLELSRIRPTSEVRKEEPSFVNK